MSDVITITTDQAQAVAHLVRAVKHMRYAQRRYFQNRQHISPREAIRMEDLVDGMLRQLPALLPSDLLHVEDLQF